MEPAATSATPSQNTGPGRVRSSSALMALESTGAQYETMESFPTSPVTAALLANLEPILSPFWVFVFLGELPGVLTLIGAAIVLTAATVYSIMGARRPAEENF